MKKLKIDNGKTDLRFYFSRLFLKISNRWWSQAINTNHQTIKKNKETQRNKYLQKNICAWEEKFNSVFLVQRVGVETVDHLCFRTSAWTDRHSLFPRGAWFTSRQKCERSDQIWKRSETQQLLRLSTNYERAHFKRTDEWRQSATTIYYFMLMLKQTRRRIGRRQTCPKNSSSWFHDGKLEAFPFCHSPHISLPPMLEPEQFYQLETNWSQHQQLCHPSSAGASSEWSWWSAPSPSSFPCPRHKDRSWQGGLVNRMV